MDADRGDVAEVGDPVREGGAHAWQPLRPEGERGEGGLEQDALRLPLIDVVALHDAVPPADLLLVAGADPGGGVDVEVTAEGGMANARAQKQLGRAERASGADHCLRAHLPIAAGRRPAVARQLLGARDGQAGAAGETRRSSVLHQDTLHLDAGAYASTSGHGAGKIGDMGRPLRVKPATEGAGAALHASSGVAADRPTAGAERLRALRAELAVSPERLEVKRSHGERLLRSRVERVEV